MAPLSPRFDNAWGPSALLTEDDLPFELLAVVVESLLFGMHVVLFPICARILFRRRRKIQLMMLAAVAVMFALATADVAVSWRLFLRHTKWLYTEDIHLLYKAVFPKFWIFLVNNVIADVLLILRCYVVWGRRKSILILTGLFLVVSTVFGIIGEGTTIPSLKRFIIIYIILSLVLNLGVTVLTAGRIIWIAREVKKIVGKELASHYHFAVGVLVESGLIYTASMVLVVVLSPTNFVLMAAVISIRVVCIVPILLIVQIMLGQSVKDVQTTVNKLQGGTTGRPPVVLDTIVSTNIEFDQSRGAAYEEPDTEETEDTGRLEQSDSSSAPSGS